MVDGREESINDVHFLKTDPKARYQGYSFYFREGLCWSDINTKILKCRKKQKSIHDVKSMSVFSVEISVPDEYIIALINSSLINHYVDNFVNNTQTFQINDARQIPIVIPTEGELAKIEQFVLEAILIKKSLANERLLNVLQRRIDCFIKRIYHFL